MSTTLNSNVKQNKYQFEASRWKQLINNIVVNNNLVINNLGQ